MAFCVTAKSVSTRSEVVNVLVRDIVVSEFDIQSRYYVHFRINTRGKGMNPLIRPAMSYIEPLLSSYLDGFGIKHPTKVDIPLNKEVKPKSNKKMNVIKNFLFYLQG